MFRDPADRKDEEGGLLYVHSVYRGGQDVETIWVDNGLMLTCLYRRENHQEHPHWEERANEHDEWRPCVDPVVLDRAS